jgi:hypothetical protein
VLPTDIPNSSSGQPAKRLPLLLRVRYHGGLYQSAGLEIDGELHHE